MATIHPAAAEHHRKRWLRHDAYRFAPPGSSEADPGFLHPWAAVARAEEAKAAADQAERESLRADLEHLHRLIKDLRIDLALRRLRHKYSPDQPRVPAGNPDGGQWTDGEGSSTELTDFSAQARRGGPPRAPTSVSREAYLDQLTGRAQEAVSRVQALDPNWRPTPSFTATNRGENLEARIRANEDILREADARFLALSRADRDAPYPMPNPPTTSEVVVPKGQLAGVRDLRAGDDARVLNSIEFETIRQTLMGGARRIDPGADYDGVWYRREDGSIFGLRLSSEHGLTLEVIRNDHPLARPGLRFHQR